MSSLRGIVMGKHTHQTGPATRTTNRRSAGWAAIVLGVGSVVVTMFAGAADAAVDASATCVTTTSSASGTNATGANPTTTVTTTASQTVTQTVTQTQAVTQTQTVTQTEPGPTVTVTESGPTVTQTETQPATTVTVTEPGPTVTTTTGSTLLALKRIDVSGTVLSATSLPTCTSSGSATVTGAATPLASDSSGAAASEDSQGVAAESDSRIPVADPDGAGLASTGGPGKIVLLVGFGLLATGLLVVVSTSPRRRVARRH